jgi:hypothetical protein
VIMPHRPVPEEMTRKEIMRELRELDYICAEYDDDPAERKFLLERELLSRGEDQD